MTRNLNDELMKVLGVEYARATKIRLSPAPWQEMVAVWRAVMPQAGDAEQPKTFALVPIEEDERLDGYTIVIEREFGGPTILERP